MEVREHVDLGDGHFIEFGTATWDAEQQSVRNRYPTSNGGFSPRSSSEPIGDVEEIAIATLERDVLDPATTMRILRAAADSIERRLRP